MMELNNEMLEKAKTAKSAEELLELAKANGVNLTEEEAKTYFNQLNKSGELADDELDNVAGGAGCKPTALSKRESGDDIQVGDVFRLYSRFSGTYLYCSACGPDLGGKFRATGKNVNFNQKDVIGVCLHCGKSIRFLYHDGDYVFDKEIL